MPIGAVLRYLPSRSDSGLQFHLRSLYQSTYLRFYGTHELHDHIRWRAIKPLISSACPTGKEVVFDVGCGDGLISFEVAARLNTGRVIGIDVDPERIRAAKQISEKSKAKNVDFRLAGASGIVDIPDDFCDVVLLIDVIEHIVDDRSVLDQVGRIVKPGGAVIISVPTPNYPKVFGRKLHNEIGHVRDGYSIETLEQLLGGAGMYIEGYKYHTYPPSALVCFPYYRCFRKINFPRVLTSPLLNIISYLDHVWPIRRPTTACGIGLVARRKRAELASLKGETKYSASRALPEG
jgi:2-polyprenyl-3-methyl-5-hydroxy-6-metoxy-1,4-benzoquinol methylase